MKTVHYISTLFYYDGPLVFEARDNIGGHYVGVAVTLPGDRDGHLVKGVAPDSLRAFRAGEMDLRTLLLEAEAEGWYLTHPEFDFDAPIKLEKQNSPLAGSEYLPDAGFLLHEHPADDSVVKEARMRNNFVVEVTANAPYNAMQSRIRTDVYKQLLGVIEGLAKHAHKSMCKVSNMLYSQSSHAMDVVVPASPGSFRFMLEGTKQPDVFGHNELSLAWGRVDEVVLSALESEYQPDALQQYRGHLAGACLEFLKLLAKRKIDVGYAWANPNSSRASMLKVSAAQARPLVESLSKIDNLSAEEVTLVGDFEKFNRPSGVWGLLTDEGKKSGKIKTGGPSLDGLQVGERYRFHCVEEITQSLAGNEVSALYLQAHEPA